MHVYSESKKTNAELQPTKPLLHKHTYTVLLYRTRRHNIHTKPRKESGDFPFGRRVLLPRLSAWSRLAPTPLTVCELSPALLAQTRRSATPPVLLRLPSVPPWIGRPPNREHRTKTTGTPRRRRGPRRQKDSRDKRLVKKTQDSRTTKSSGDKGLDCTVLYCQEGPSVRLL